MINKKIQNEKTAAASISFLLPSRSRSRSRSPPTSLSNLLPISLSLSLSLAYLPPSHKAATKASDIATNHGAVLLGRRPPAQPAIAQQTCWSWLLEAKILDYHLSYVRLLGKELSKSKSTKVIGRLGTGPSLILEESWNA